MKGEMWVECEEGGFATLCELQRGLGSVRSPASFCGHSAPGCQGRCVDALFL